MNIRKQKAVVSKKGREQHGVRTRKKNYRFQAAKKNAAEAVLSPTPF
jgi:hypothetical protein